MTVDGANGAGGGQRFDPQTSLLIATLARVGAAVDLEAALGALAAGAIALLGGDRGAVRAYDVGAPGRHVAFWVQADGTLSPADFADPLPGSVAADLKAGGPARVIDDLWALDPAVSPLYGQLRLMGMRASVAVPIMAGDQCIGSLHVDHHQVGFFGAQDLALAEVLASQAGLVVERARLAAERTELAARRRAEEARRETEAQLQAILDNTTSVIYVKDEAGRFVLVNRRFESLFHVRREGVLGRTDADLFGPQVAAAFQANDRHVLATGKTLEVEEVVPQDDGPHTYLSVKFPLRAGGGGHAAVCGISTDISERAQLFAAEQHARRDAEQALRVRDEFLAVAAHELKTPLTPIRGIIQLILRRLERDGTLEAEFATRACRMLDRQAIRLDQLVTRLLDVSRLESGRLTLQREPTDLALLVRRIAEATQMGTTRHQVEVSVPAHVPMVADPLRLEQVVANLLDNAVKFSPPGAAIDVQVTVSEGETAQIAVRDHGPGIPPQHRPHIFERLYQGSAEGRSTGLGLGLYIARQIVALHGGTIVADYPADGGTRFVVTLPVGTETSLPAPAVFTETLPGGAGAPGG